MNVSMAELENSDGDNLGKSEASLSADPFSKAPHVSVRGMRPFEALEVFYLAVP